MRIITKIIGIGALGLLACGCAGGSTNWYAAGRSFVYADNKVDQSVLAGPTDIVRQWCSQVLTTGQAPVKPHPLPPLGGREAQKWVSGCIAGYFESHPNQKISGGYLQAVNSAQSTPTEQPATPITSPPATPLSVDCTLVYWVPENDMIGNVDDGAYGWVPAEDDGTRYWSGTFTDDASAGWEQAAQLVINGYETPPAQPPYGYAVVINFDNSAGQSVYSETKHFRIGEQLETALSVVRYVRVPDRMATGASTCVADAP